MENLLAIRLTEMIDETRRLDNERFSMIARLISHVASFSVISVAISFAAEPVAFQVKPTVALEELNPAFCWFHPRAAAIPKLGKDGQPAVIMTIQKHLIADDYYSGLWVMRTDDLGKTWTGPLEIPELAWRKEPGVPYGRAISSKYLEHDTPEALQFIGWFCRLYDISLPTSGA